MFPFLEEFSTVCGDLHIKGFGVISKAEVDVFLELSWRVKVDSEKAGLKLNIQKTKIMASGPITS